MITTRRSRHAGLVAALLIVGTACGGGGDADDAGTTEATTTAATNPADDDPADDGVDDVDDVDDVDVSVDTAAPDDPNPDPDDAPSPSTTVAGPQGTPLVEGLPAIELLGPAETDAGAAPLFQWRAVDGASTYRLAVLGPDGPIWSWSGEATEVYLGGLDFEQPAGWAGPQLVDGTCWSVAARDDAGDVIAVSSFVPVSVGSEPGPACIPPGG